jgi:hypothetical protein
MFTGFEGGVEAAGAAATPHADNRTDAKTNILIKNSLLIFLLSP